MASITITAPTLGETLIEDEVYVITWTSIDVVAGVDIYYWDEDEWILIIENTANDGSHSWTVPALNRVDVKIKIIEHGGAVNDESDEFIVLKANITGLLVESD